ELERTDVQQPAIFVTNVAIWEAWLEAGASRESVTHCGGLSLGEYTALHVAGAVSFEDALRLVRRRGELMQQAAFASPSGMVSLVGADEAAARALCERARGGDVLAPANFNCPGQIVIAGSRSACERAVALAGEFQCRAVPLAVAGAFHSPLMQSAADGLEPVLEQTRFTTPRMKVIANVDAEYHRDPGSIRDSLRRQVTQPVLWQRCVERIMEDGVGQFVEIGPGRILTGLMRKINRNVPCANVSTAESIASALAIPSAG
ncbi:MAG: ACP S-malonyltransferase, partial [Planctomycetota bacterium]